MDEINIPPPASAVDYEKSNQKPDKETAFASQTPEKTIRPLLFQVEDPEFQINPMCEELTEIFDCMTTSLRLLTLRKKPTTFKNISLQIQLLRRREFSYSHLAQIKYILTEAVQVDTILIHDKSTLCMKPEMRVTLHFDIVEGHHERSDFLALHQIFASRLAHYFTMHPEASHIPEATLPHPFNQKDLVVRDGVGDISETEFTESFSKRSVTTVPEQLRGSSSHSQFNLTEGELLSKSSHLCPSSSGSFCRRVFVSEKDKTKLLASPRPLLVAAHSSPSNQENKATRTQELPTQGSNSNMVIDVDVKDEHSGELGTYTKSAPSDSPPIQIPNPQSSVDNPYSSTPQCKIAASANGLAIETPAQLTPIRASSDSADKHKTMGYQKQTSSCKPAKRSLDFSFTEGKESFSYTNIDGCFEFPHVTQTQDSSPTQLKEVKKNLGFAVEDQNQSDHSHEQMSVSLTDLVSLVNQIFHSVNYSTITKEELLHKMIINSLDFVDKSEAEEGIQVLENLVPDWICRKLTQSGDILYNVKKMADLSSVQSKVISG